MKIWMGCLLMSALFLMVPVFGVPTIEISPKSNELLYSGMPIVVHYSELNDNDEIFINLEQWRIPDDSCPRAIMMNLQNPITFSGTMISGETVEESENLYVDGFISQISHDDYSSGDYLIIAGETDCSSENNKNITYAIVGEKISGVSSGSFVFQPYAINPEKGYMRINVEIWGDSGESESEEIIPYDLGIAPPVVQVVDTSVTVGEEQTGDVTLSQVSSGLSIYNLTLNLSESGTIGKYKGVTFPLGVNTDIPVVTDSSISFNATTNIGGQLEDFTLCTVTYEGISTGEAFSNVTVRGLKNETGASILPSYTINGTLTVTSAPLPPSDFTGVPTSGIIPFDVSFTNMSQKGEAYFNWSYGDNTPNDSTSNPVHTYWLSGDHDVTLTVLSDVGENTTQKQGYITGRQVPIWFKSNLTQGEAPLLVTFNGTTMGSHTDWVYQFGDGDIDHEPNVTHQYNVPGTYTVRASANLGGARSTAVRYQYIQVN